MTETIPCPQYELACAEQAGRAGLTPATVMNLMQWCVVDYHTPDMVELKANWREAVAKVDYSMVLAEIQTRRLRLEVSLYFD